MKVYIGMDVHCKESVFVAQDEEGNMLCEGRIATTMEGLMLLREKYHLPEETKVAIETGTSSFFVARQLIRLGFEPVVVDAHEVRLKARRPNQKSDRRDAFELCEGIRRGIYSKIVHVPSMEIQELRETLSRRRHFVRLMTREVNSVKHLLRSIGMVNRVKLLRTEAAWERLLKDLGLAHDLQRLVECHCRAWSCAHKQVLCLEEEMKRFMKHFSEDLNRLQVILGVGPIVALTVIAVLSDVRRFPSVKHVASYAGFVPCTWQTGESNFQGHITKRGSPEIRAMLCEAAHQAAKPRHPLNPYFKRICAKRGYKMAIVAVAHRLLRIMFVILRDKTEFSLEKLGVESGPFEVTMTQWYRRKMQSIKKVAA